MKLIEKAKNMIVPLFWIIIGLVAAAIVFWIIFAFWLGYSDTH